MSDDIVTRLRKAVAQTAEANTLPSWDFATIVWEAAAEIERLRELADNLYLTLQNYPCQCMLSKCKCGYDDMMDEYKDIRGER
jgi:hypothetical protein